jgi:lipoyl(octanoyl) transferase
MSELRVLTPGVMPYDDAVRLQEDLRAEVTASDGEKAYLVLVEHPPVITVGRGAEAGHVLADATALERQGVELRETSRGGDVTYHGPGQLVGYPILDLRRRGREPDVHRYLRDLEEVVIDMLAEFGIVGRREPGLTGVWTERGKVAAIGVAVRRWVTMHGFAVNADPVMAHFGLIVPCGLADRQVTSMTALLERPVSVGEIIEPTARSFSRVFGMPLSTGERGG